jgi:quercetin 2,3-dioxygenase
MVGAWCFLDRFGPIDVTPDRTMTVGPHPHIGLHTVTWLLEGEVLHSDSLGNRQPIRPGQLNLMTAGGGIAHAEDARRSPSGPMDGVQLWVAQPEHTRHGPSSFAHHADLPQVDLPNGEATILLGEFAGSRSPAVTDSAVVGVDVGGSGVLDLPLDPASEHAVAVLRGRVEIEDARAKPNELVYLGTDRTGLTLFLEQGSRMLLLGGPPFPEEIAMWWNFVARDRTELASAYTDWNDGTERFGPVTTSLPRIDAPRPFWLD